MARFRTMLAPSVAPSVGQRCDGSLPGRFSLPIFALPKLLLSRFHGEYALSKDRFTHLSKGGRFSWSTICTDFLHVSGDVERTLVASAIATTYRYALRIAYPCLMTAKRGRWALISCGPVRPLLHQLRDSPCDRRLQHLSTISPSEDMPLDYTILKCGTINPHGSDTDESDSDPAQSLEPGEHLPTIAKSLIQGYPGPLSDSVNQSSGAFYQDPKRLDARGNEDTLRQRFIARPRVGRASKRNPTDGEYCKEPEHSGDQRNRSAGCLYREEDLAWKYRKRSSHTSIMKEWQRKKLRSKNDRIAVLKAEIKKLEAENGNLKAEMDLVTGKRSRHTSSQNAGISTLG